MAPAETGNSQATWRSWTTEEICTSDTYDVWDSWNSSSSTTYTSDTVWSDWNDDTTAPSRHYVTQTSQIWYIWNSETKQVVQHANCNASSFQVLKENHKERMKKRRKGKRQQILFAKRNEKNRRKSLINEWEKGLAGRKARQLLEDVIGKDQMIPFEKSGKILVKGQKFDWLISKEGAVKRVEKNKIVSLCVHLNNGFKYPMLDRVVGFALMAKYAEDYLNEEANSLGSRNKSEDLDLCAQM